MTKPLQGVVPLVFVLVRRSRGEDRSRLLDVGRRR